MRIISTKEQSWWVSMETMTLEYLLCQQTRIGVRMRLGLRMRTELGVTRSYSTCYVIVHSLLLSIAIDQFFTIWLIFIPQSSFYT